MSFSTFLKRLERAFVVFLLFICLDTSAQCPATISASASPVTATCPSNGSITVSSNADGITGAGYQITSGPASGGYPTALQTSPVFSNLPPGSYTITVSCGGATGTATTTVNSTYAPLGVTAVASNLCTSGTKGGTITVTATGGNIGTSGQYRYAVLLSSDPAASNALFTYQTSNTFSVTEFGTYQVRAVDDCGNFSTYTLTMAPLYPAAGLSMNYMRVGCNVRHYGNLVRADGSYFVPEADYTYQIWAIAPSSCSPGSGAPIASGVIPAGKPIGLDTGTAMVRVTQSYAQYLLFYRITSPCGEVTESCFGIPRNPYDAGAAVTTYLNCNPANPRVHAYLHFSNPIAYPARLHITNIYPPVPPTPIPSPDSPQNVFLFNYQGSYEAIYSDACGIQGNFIYFSPPLPSDPFIGTVTTSLPGCGKPLGTTGVSILLSGYAPGILESPYQLKASDGTVIASGTFASDRAVINVPVVGAGTYTVTVTPDSCPPLTTQPFTISSDNPALLKLTIQASATQACGGTGTITAAYTTNSTAGLSFALFNSANALVASNLTGVFTGLSPDTYTVKAILDYTPCGLPDLEVTSSPVTILAPGSLPVITSATGSVCTDAAGNPLSTGAVTLAMTGIGPFGIEQKLTSAPPASFTLAASNANSPYTLSGLTPGEQYTFRLTDKCGNTTTTDVTISNWVPLQLQTTLEPCPGLPYTLAVEDRAGVSYTWTKGGSTVGTGRTLDFVSFSAADDGIYTCTILAGCVTQKITANLHSSACGAALPVTLAYFSGKSKSEYNLLAWKAVREDRFAYYIVEKSVDVRNWQAIARLDPKGSGAEYNFRDYETGTAPALYYRLKMVDNDGTFEYSRVVPLVSGRNSRYSVYPNPAHDHVTVSGLTPGTPIRFFDAAGRNVVSRIASESTEVIPVKHLAPQVYFVRVGKDDPVTVKIVVK